MLALLAISRLIETGCSAVPWSIAQDCLADLLSDFGPASTTARAQSAAYPFTRLRSDAVWKLDDDVPMDNVSPLTGVTGSFVPAVERALLRPPDRAFAIALALVTSHFPEYLVPDVLTPVSF